MKLKKALLSCLMLAGVMTATAQEQTAKTEYVHNPYWYVQVQAGGQYTLGEIDFSDLLSPNVQVAVGRQFTPVFGLRLAVNAWQSRAGWEFSEAPVGTVKWKWQYVAPGLDATFNLSNLFAGYNPTRLFQFTVFGGLGANIGWGFDKKSNWDNEELLGQHTTATNENLQYAWDGTKVRLYGRVGVAGDFRISDKVSLGLEVNANTLSDRYNGKKAGNLDWYFNALVGAKINLGKTYTTRTIEAPKAPERVVEKVIERVVEKPCPQPVMAPTHAIERKAEAFRRDVFFTIASTIIPRAEQQKVKEVADYMKANPNSKVNITGYSSRDNAHKLNLRLSQQRAQAVYKMLVNQYKIAANRIKVDYKGDSEQPFAVHVENQVAICIAE